MFQIGTAALTCFQDLPTIIGSLCSEQLSAAITWHPSKAWSSTSRTRFGQSAGSATSLETEPDLVRRAGSQASVAVPICPLLASLRSGVVPGALDCCRDLFSGCVLGTGFATAAELWDKKKGLEANR